MSLQVYPNFYIHELAHDKTNKMTGVPNKTRISVGNRQVWTESWLCALWVPKEPNHLHADSEDWLGWVDAQTDLSLRCMDMPTVNFVMLLLKYLISTTNIMTAKDMLKRILAFKLQKNRRNRKMVVYPISTGIQLLLYVPTLSIGYKKKHV